MFGFFLFVFCMCLFVCLFVCHSTRQIFTYMETSPLQVKYCKFWPELDTHFHWAVRVLSVPHLLWHGTSLFNGPFQGAITTCSFRVRQTQKLRYDTNEVFSSKLPLYTIKSHCFYWIYWTSTIHVTIFVAGFLKMK